MILLILNDDKETERHKAVDRKYSFKILFTSVHLNNQTASGQRILSSYLIHF